MLVKELLHLHLFVTSFLQVLPEHLNVGAAVLPFFTQVVKSLIILTPDWVSHIPEDVRVSSKPVRVFQVFEHFGWLNSMLGAHLLVRVLPVSLLSITHKDVVAKQANIIDKVHVVTHDQNIVSLVDLTFDL